MICFIPPENGMDRLAAMETFVLVVETGSFSAAARRLGVGQPAVSKTVAQLETRLGVKLLARSTRGLSPTEAGQGFFERAKRAIEEADAADLAAKGAGNGLTGRLRICAAVTFARIHLIPRLPEFDAKHPDLELDVILDDRNVDLVQEGIDLAFRMGALQDSSLKAKRIGRSARRVMGTPAYFKQRGTPKIPGDLLGHDLVVYQQGESGVWSFRKGSAETSVEIKSRLKVTAAEGVRAAVLADLGVTIASEWMFTPELRNKAVRGALTDWQLPSVDLWAVFPSGRLATAKARSFLSFFEGTFEKA